MNATTNYHRGAVIVSEAPQNGRRFTREEIGDLTTPGVLRCGIIRRGSDDRDAFGIFPSMIHFRPSCTPNVHQKWIEASGLMEFVAIRPIRLGDILCISRDIQGLLLSRQDRSTQLQQYGIVCDCQACQPGNLITNGRRETIRRVIRDPPVPTAQAQLLLIRTALNLMAAEGLHHWRDTLFFDGFSLCAQVQDRANAQLWINKAWDQTSITLSPQDSRRQEVTALRTNPTSWHRWAESPPAILFPPPAL